MPLDFANYQPEDAILSTLIRADEFLSGQEKWGRPGHVGKCVSNVLIDVSGLKPGCSPAHYFIMEMLGARYCMGIFAWNDAPERTFEEVKAFLASAIEKRRAEVLEGVL